MCCCLSDGTLSRRSCVHGYERNACKRILKTERVGVYPGVSCSHGSSGFLATVIKCTFEGSLVSLSEMYKNLIFNSIHIYFNAVLKIHFCTSVILEIYITLIKYRTTFRFNTGQHLGSGEAKSFVP